MKPLILTVLVLTAIQAISNLISDWHKAEGGHSILDEVDIDIEGLRQAEAEFEAKHPEQHEPAQIVTKRTARKAVRKPARKRPAKATRKR